MILDFELNPNIWIEFKSWSKYLDINFKIFKLVLLKNEFRLKIWFNYLYIYEINMN